MSSFATNAAGLGDLDSSSLIVTYSTALLTAVLAIYWWLLPKPIAGIPYHKESAKSIWGDVLELRADKGGLAKWSEKQLERHGTPICQALMGPLSKPVVLVANIPETREMLTGRAEFDRSAYIYDRFPLFGDFHLNMKTGDAWRTSRSWLKDLLDKPHLMINMCPRIYAHTVTLLEVWERKSQMAEGHPFSVVRDLKNLSLDVIMDFHFGDDFQDTGLLKQTRHVKQLDKVDLKIGQHGEVYFPGAKMHKFQQGLADSMDKMAEIYASKWHPALVSFWVRWISPHYKSMFDSKDRFIRGYIDLSVTRTGDESNLKSGLDFMVYREQKGAAKAQKPSVSGKQIMIDETYGNLVAGQHTTSAAMVWVLKLLTDNPEAANKLRDELQTHLVESTRENRLPTVDEIMNTKLVYLDAVLEEVLRLRAGMLVPRDTTRDTELMGHRIPKGTTVLLVCQGPDFSPSPSTPYWQQTRSEAAGKFPGANSRDPEHFDPGRWLVEQDNGEVKFDSTTLPQLAFGLGMRACWGRRLAYLEMKIMTAMVTLKFDYGQVPKELSSHDATYDISYQANQGWVNLKSRSL